MDSVRLGPELQPGDICAHDGLYQVIHQVHREPHKVVVSKGDAFPHCKHCGKAVRFHLVMPSTSQPKRLRAKAAPRRSAGHG